MTEETTELVADFRKAAGLAGIRLSVDDLRVELLSAPHRPPSRLPAGKMAVYVFHYRCRALKVGKAGPNSTPRYTSHHYGPRRAGSTLAASILERQREIGLRGVTEKTVGDWIRTNTDRYNFLLDSSHPDRLLTLLEAFLQCRLDPVFEGSSNRR